MASAPPQSPPVPVIVNVTSGAGHSKDITERLQGLFDEERMPVSFRCARGGAQLTELAREAMRARPRLVVAAGGDGTLGALAEAVRGTDTALGILPLGTFNHFAKDLGIPLDLAQAVRTVARGVRTPVDVGEVNGACFLNNSSLGMYPAMVRGRELQQRLLGRRKYPAMAWAMLAVLRRSPFLRLRLELDESTHECRAPFVFIGNNEYRMQGFEIGTRERLDGGRLSIYTTPRRSRWGLVALALRALVGRLDQADDFSALAARTVRVESSRRRLLVATDGEVTLMDTPLEYRLLPRSLLVMTPAREA